MWKRTLKSTREYRLENYFMSDELCVYTGELSYKNIDFSFVFDNEKLRLIPPEDKRHEIEWKWRYKQIGNGAYTFADPIPVGVDYLSGKCNETQHRIIFIPKNGSTLSFNNSVVYIQLKSYVVCKYDRDTVDRISFSCPEINYIFPVNQALSLCFPTDEFIEKGIVHLSTRSFDETTSEKQFFNVDGKRITAYFGISRTVSTKIHEAPLSLNSTLMFEFDETNDYYFIHRLWWIAREYVRFLCYRKNVYIPNVELSAPYEGGKHEAFATMYILDEEMTTEADTLKQGRYIKQVHISGHEGEILSDIAEDNLYLRHLPDTYRSGRHINAARFVMITAAFEWEFRRLYPNGVIKTEATIKAENDVSQNMQEMIATSTGKKKQIYKFLKKLVKSDSLEREIIQMGKDFDDIIGAFGRRLYQLKEQELKYADMGKRLAEQRNHFAHGDLDKDFIGLSLLDLIYMEYVVYAMQLKHYGVEEINIKKSINELFQLSIAI